ncbi:MAG: hypothetical protein K2N51_07465 [Lachnospiraceae bacterium]|nr:hypothetical protein [Lachnospiraceae bacterium]
MKRIIRWIEKSILVIGILFFGWILMLDLFMGNRINYYCKSRCLVSNSILIGIGVLLLCIFVFLVKRYADKINRILGKGDRIIGILSVVLFLVELIISYEILFASGWDAGEVCWQAGLVAAGESKLDNSYFSNYPNNLLITFLYSLAYRLMGVFGLQMYGAVIIVAVQCFLSALTGYLLYQVSKKMFHNNKISFVVWTIYGLWIGLMPWYTVTYSEPLGIIFPVAILWLYQRMESNKAVWRKSILIGILSFLGYQIKPSVLIIYIAILIIAVLRFIENKERNVRTKQICGLIVSFFVVFGIYQQIDIGKCMGFELNKEQELTITHFAMMGLSEKRNGVFDMDEVDYSLSFPNKKRRQEENVKIIKQRLKDYGFWGIVNHLAKKTLTNYNDGTFSWGKEGEFFSEEIEKPEEILSETLKDLYYNDGKHRIILNTYMQFFLIMILLGVFLNCIQIFNNKKIMDSYLITMLALVGIFLFVSIFEARARYLYVYAPLYILMGVQGYTSILYFLLYKLKYRRQNKD